MFRNGERMFLVRKLKDSRKDSSSILNMLFNRLYYKELPSIIFFRTQNSKSGIFFELNYDNELIKYKFGKNKHYNNININNYYMVFI